MIDSASQSITRPISWALYASMADFTMRRFSSSVLLCLLIWSNRIGKEDRDYRLMESESAVTRLNAHSPGLIANRVLSP